MECGDEMATVREIKQEVLDEDPDTLEEGGYQVIYVKEEIEDEDSRQDGGEAEMQMTTESSTESVGNPSLRNSNWDSGWQLPEEDEEEDASEVGNADAPFQYRIQDSNRQLSGDTEEQDDRGATNPKLRISGCGKRSHQGTAGRDKGKVLKTSTKTGTRVAARTQQAATEAGSSAQEEEEVEASQPVGRKQRGKGGKRCKVFLTDEQKEEVIEFLIRNEGLYNKKKELWQQPHKKKKLWQQQGRAMGVDWKDLHTWYETQRRRIGRLKWLANKSGSGSLEDTWKETDLEFWQRWQFLRSHINIQSQKPVVSLHRRLANAPAPSRALEAGPTQDEFETDREDQPATCRSQTTPTTTGHSTPVSTTMQSTRHSNTNDVDQIMEALVSSSERHDQLINLSESLLRSQQVPAGQSRGRHQFNLWCGSLVQELPQDLYEQCEADMFRLMTHYRNLAHQCPAGQAAAAPRPPQQPQQSYNQAGWQPHPSDWMPNPPAASSSLLNDDQLLAPPPLPTTADMATAPTATATSTAATFRAVTPHDNQ